jgi:hypothetical protein
LAERERAAGYDDGTAFRGFARRVEEAKRQILGFLIGLKAEGKAIAGYGAPAKANTLLNFCGVGTDFIEYTVDVSPHKQGHLMPGTHIPIFAPEALRETRPDVVLILPWNLQREIMDEHAYVSEWGGRFAARSPELRLL